MPLQNLFKGKILRKTKGSINGNPLYKELNQKIVNASKTTVDLSDGKIIRKSDIALPKSSLSTIRSFRGNISFEIFHNSNFKAGSKRLPK